MFEQTQAIDWVRWLFYFLGGIPVLIWLFAVRDRALRLLAVLAISFFVQDLFAGRRYFWAFSLSPALAGAYVGLLAVLVERRRLPQPGIYGVIWAGLLFAALVGVTLGSRGGLLAVNVKYFQLGYLDGLIFFFFGLMALQTSREFQRFWEGFIVITLLTAMLHLFSVATGYQFRGSYTMAAGNVVYGGVFDNNNTLGSFYAMAIPPVLSLVMTRTLSARMQAIGYVTIALAAGSMILTGCRTAYLFAPILAGVALVRAGVAPGRAVATGVLGVVLVAIGFLLMTWLTPEVWQRVSADLAEEGTRTERFHTFAGFLRLMLDHPFGIGLSPENARGLIERYTFRGILSSHNIYIDMAVQIGVIGMIVFLWLAWMLLRTNRHAMKRSDDPAERQGLFCVYLALLGYYAVGIFQPIYTASVTVKMNNLFWLLAGLNVAAVNRVLAAHRAEREQTRRERDAVPLPVRARRA